MIVNSPFFASNGLRFSVRFCRAPRPTPLRFNGALFASTLLCGTGVCRGASVVLQIRLYIGYEYNSVFVYI